MQEITVTTATSTLVHRQHHTIDALTYHPNAAADSVRRLRRLAGSTASVASSLIIPNTRAAGRVIDVSRDDNPCITADVSDACSGTGASNNTGYQDPPPTDNTNDVGTEMSSIIPGSGFSVILQHGFLSKPDTWNRMNDWLNADFHGTSTYAPKLDWKQTYENQAAQLGQSLHNNAVPGRAILVGHSNGGMVNRYLAENPSLASGVNIGGVVTIGTPHRGAPLARYPRDMDRMLGIGGVAALIICSYPNEGGCSRFLSLLTSSLTNYYLGFSSSVPVLNEMQPNDQYHANFNATPESFQRYGIESYGWHMWKIFAEYGGAYCYSDSPCGDYKQAKKTDRSYHHDVTCSIIGLFTFDSDAAGGCAADAVFLKAINNVYNRYTETSGDGTYIGDGVVPAWSQPYPNIPSTDQYPIYDGPSHLAETSSPMVGHQLQTILTQRFNMQQTNSVF